MQLIKINKIKKYYGDRLILDIENIEIFEGERVGIVGVNGSGKTTLLNIIAGKEEYELGNIYVDSSCSYINQLDEEVDIEESKFTKELKIPNKYRQHLSGGEKVKTRIAKALNSNSRIIIADEPTANLDMDSIKYLEEKLNLYNGAVLLVSHDREFLDSICNKIIEIHNGKVNIFNGNYSSYIRQKEEKIKRENFEYEQFCKEKKRLEEAVNAKTDLRDGIKKTPKRFGNSESRLHKMGNQSAKKNMDNAIKSLKTRIDKLEEKEKPTANNIIKIDIEAGQEFYSNFPIEIRELNISFEEKEILSLGSCRIRKNTRLALIGENGCGKTSLIKEIIRNESENIKIAKRVNIGYFQQDLKILKDDMSIIENIKESSTKSDTFIRIVLSRFLFKDNDIFKKIKVLSGGEKVRVSLCKVLLSDNNLLILDEPTNYLDIKSMEALEDALKNSNKTMIIVSHDRRFITNVCNELIIFENKILRHMPYSYEQWLEKINESPMKKEEKKKEEKILILKNRLSEVISLLSMERDDYKRSKYEEYYDELLKEIKMIKK